MLLIFGTNSAPAIFHCHYRTTFSPAIHGARYLTQATSATRQTDFENTVYFVRDQSPSVGKLSLGASQQEHGVVAQSPNLILASLPENVFTALQPRLRTVDLPFGAVIAEIGKPVSQVYFPHSGVVSIVVEMEVGEMIETAMIGRDGVANAMPALNGKISFHKAITQIAGVASAIGVDTLRPFADDFQPLRSALIGHEQVLLAQTQQSAACNASHTVQARMCRWLLRMHDLTQSSDLSLTQEFLAQMLGVRRTSVSLVAGELQRAGLIKYKRGNIHLEDAKQIRDCACECYENVRLHYERQFKT
jgi:CRP-like cAMP-binding protein